MSDGERERVFLFVCVKKIEQRNERKHNSEKKKKAKCWKKKSRVFLFVLFFLVLCFLLRSNLSMMHASSLSLNHVASLKGCNKTRNRSIRSGKNGIGGRQASVVAIAAVASVSASASASSSSSSSSKGSSSKFLDGPSRAAKFRQLLAKPGILVVSGVLFLWDDFFFVGTESLDRTLRN